MRTGDQVVQELPWRWHTQGMIFLVGGLGFMFDAWDVALNGFLIPLVGAEWGLSTAERGWVGTANLIGMAVGAFAWGGIADLVGRQRAFRWTLLMFSLFTVAGAASPDFVTFCVFRFLAGAGLGGCIPVDYALVGEFTPATVRGRVLTAMDVWWPIGALSIYNRGLDCYPIFSITVQNDVTHRCPPVLEFILRNGEWE